MAVKPPRIAARLGVRTLVTRALSALVPFVVLATLLHSRPLVHVSATHTALGARGASGPDPRVWLPPPDASVALPSATFAVPDRSVPTVAPVPSAVPRVPPGTPSGAPSPATAVTPVRPRAAGATTTPRPRLPGTTEASPQLVPATGDPSLVATATVSEVPLYQARTAAAPFAMLGNPDALGSGLTFLVAGSEEGWVQAYVPERPNGSAAWIPAADVTISSVDSHVVVDLTTRTLTLYVHNAPVWHVPAAPGAPGSPTPAGLFYVTDVVQVADPQSQYGPYLLALSGFSDSLLHFDGGPGQIAIHGTNQPQSIGTDASNGCVRLGNAAVTALAQAVVPGTPVQIGY